MELLSVIYNSLMIVFALLSLVILSSLICSKTNFCGEKKRRNRKEEHNFKLAEVQSERTHHHYSVSSENEDESSARNNIIHEAFPAIKQELVENKKVRVVSRRELNDDFDRDFQYHLPSASRFTVVNTMLRETPREDLFPKYSSLSIKYSQIA